MSDKSQMSPEISVPSGKSIKVVESTPKPVVPVSDLKKWQESIGRGLEKAAFEASVTEYERQQAEKRINGHIATSASSQFEADAGKVVEEEAIRTLNKPITHTQTEPAGQISSDTASLETAKQST